MRAAVIEGATRSKRVKTTGPDPAASRHPDVVNREFTAMAPNRRWVNDLTFVPTCAGVTHSCTSRLRRLASTDLGDHFRFEYVGHESSMETQPYTDGVRVTFNVLIGVAEKSSLSVDLAVGAGMTSEFSVESPATALDLPRLTSHRYRLYPVVDHIADKVRATLADYRGRASSREKDLVDLGVFAITQDIDGSVLNVAAAAPLVARLINPALTSEASGETWKASLLRWS